MVAWHAWWVLPPLPLFCRGRSLLCHASHFYGYFNRAFADLALLVSVLAVVGKTLLLAYWKKLSPALLQVTAVVRSICAPTLCHATFGGRVSTTEVLVFYAVSDFSV